MQNFLFFEILIIHITFEKEYLNALIFTTKSRSH